MATATSLRVPWRALTRSITATPTYLFRAQCAATPSLQTSTRRYASEAATSPKAAKTPQQTSSTTPSSPPKEIPEPRLPRSVQALYLRPLRRTPTYGVPTCDLQIRSYSIRNLEFFCDFALRAAYYCNLPARGPIPLPRIVERWTVPRANFAFKKSQENFERRTVRRLIQIHDGDAESVRVWLAFLRKHSYYGIGMKANVWEFTGLGVGNQMDAEAEAVKDQLDNAFDRFAFRPGSETAEKPLETINREDFRAATGANAPMIRPPL